MRTAGTEDAAGLSRRLGEAEAELIQERAQAKGQAVEAAAALEASNQQCRQLEGELGRVRLSLAEEQGALRSRCQVGSGRRCMVNRQ